MILFLCFSFDLVSIAKIYQTLTRQCLTTFPNPSKFVKNTLYFQLPSQCLEMWSNMVFCVLYITSKLFKTERISFSGDICYKVQPVLIN